MCARALTQEKHAGWYTIGQSSVNAFAIAVAVPIFFLMIGVERVVARRLGRAYYRGTDSITSLSCGVVQQATAIFVRAIVIGAYVAVWAGARVYDVDTGSPLMWALVLLAVDHQYYWFHRASHRVAFLWATHVVHHQSEEYNLTTALRQSALQAVVAAPFYWPLALLGVPPAMFIAASTANTLYQFWIHTRLVGKLGSLELVLNTPSHHRVHHGIDPKYIDKNYAGILIVWDRLYGTFVEEAEEPAFGTVRPLGSFSPIWANLADWKKIAEHVRGSTTLGERVWAFFAPPEWRPRAMGGPVVIPEVDHETRRLYDVETARAMRRYVSAQFALIGGAVVLQLLLSAEHTPLELAPLSIWIVATTAAWGGLFEKKRWAVPLEIARQLALPAVLLGLAPALADMALPVIVAGVVVALASLAALPVAIRAHPAARAA